MKNIKVVIARFCMLNAVAFTIQNATLGVKEFISETSEHKTLLFFCYRCRGLNRAGSVSRKQRG